MYNPIISNFAQQWKALTERKEAETPKIPKILKALPIIRWSEAFIDHLNRKIGARTIPLAYVIRQNATPPAVVPPLETSLPHSAEHGSVEADLIARALHTHPLYRDDNAEVYFDLEQALRGTSYIASIKPFQRSRNGRDAFFAVQNQYAGEDKWQAELKRQQDIVHNRLWKGQSNFTLDRFIAQHRNAFVMMQECANHVPFQLPNEFTRVTHLLDNIQCDDASLQAAMALVRNDRAVAPVPGKMNNFEDAAAFIIPHDPVAKKRRATQKRNQVTVASADAEENKRQKSEALISSTSAKTSVGKTGVELRFYKRKEYNALTKEQKHELWQWQQNNKAKRNSTSKTSSTKDAKNNDIAAAVAKELNKRKEAEETENEQQANFEKYIMSIVAKQSSKVTASSMQSQVEESPKVTINSILKRVKRPGKK